MRQVRVELEGYFGDRKDDFYKDGVHLSNYYCDFKWDRFPGHEGPAEESKLDVIDNADESKSDRAKGNGAKGIKQDDDGNWIIFKDYSEFERGSFF